MRITLNEHELEKLLTTSVVMKDNVEVVIKDVDYEQVRNAIDKARMEQLDVNRHRKEKS